MNIRFYKEADYKKLITHLKKCNMHDNIWESKKSIINKIRSDKQSIIVIKRKNIIIGCIFFVVFWETIMIWRLCIREKYRNQWLWSKLIQKIEKISHKRWIKQISWFVDTEKQELHERYKEHWFKKELSYYFIYKNI